MIWLGHPFALCHKKNNRHDFFPYYLFMSTIILLSDPSYELTKTSSLAISRDLVRALTTVLSTSVDNCIGRLYLPIDFVLDKRLRISWFPRLPLTTVVTVSLRHPPVTAHSSFIPNLKHCSSTNPFLSCPFLPVSTPNTIHHSRLTVYLPDSLDLTRCLCILFWTTAYE